MDKRFIAFSTSSKASGASRCGPSNPVNDGIETDHVIVTRSWIVVDLMWINSAIYLEMSDNTQVNQYLFINEYTWLNENLSSMKIYRTLPRLFFWIRHRSFSPPLSLTSLYQPFPLALFSSLTLFIFRDSLAKRHWFTVLPRFRSLFDYNPDIRARNISCRLLILYTLSQLDHARVCEMKRPRLILRVFPEIAPWQFLCVFLDHVYVPVYILT